MSARTFIVSLSLACSAGALMCWITMGDEGGRGAGKDVATKAAAAADSGPVRKAAAGPGFQGSPRDQEPAPFPSKTARSETSRSAAPAKQWSAEEMATRAARVEQEANHELRRLVGLLNLSEEQQERVFQTLAQHSRSWSPGMQIATIGSDASPSGKRSEPLSALPGVYIAPPGAGEVTAPEKSPAPTSDASPDQDTDPMDEIMALLNPEQQDALLQDEMDRAAWWAEILEQITPPEEIPSIDAGAPGLPPPPARSESKAYEGSDVLE